MTDEQKAAYIFSQSVCALVEALGMMSDNMQRQMQGYSMAYDSIAFQQLLEKYGVHHNAVVSSLYG